MKNITLILLTILSMSCQSQQKNSMNRKDIDNQKLAKYFDKLKKEVNLLGRISQENKELVIDSRIVSFIVASNTFKINNHYPHPSKKFSENFDIIDYQVKNNDGKISFWRADRQILKTNKAYPKMVANFVAAAKKLSIQQGTYNQTIKLLKDTALVFPDGLKIDLAYFSHKKTFENQRSPAIAHLELSDKHSEEKWFTIRRDEDIDEQGKFITSYESKKWKNYNIELTGLAYDGYIEIIVTRKSDKNGSKNFIDITDDLSTDEFEQIKNFILKNNGRQTYRNYDNNNPHYAFIDFDLYLGADIGQKNMDNDPNLSNFNELTIMHNILEAPIKYYQIVIVRKGDLKNGKVRIQNGMEENKVYLVDVYKKGLENLQRQLPLFLETIRKRINLTEKK